MKWAGSFQPTLCFPFSSCLNWYASFLTASPQHSPSAILLLATLWLTIPLGILVDILVTLHDPGC